MEIIESLPLGRFVYENNFTLVRGTHIYPLVLFGGQQSQDPNAYLEVIKVVAVDGVDIAITRGGGLFVRDPEGDFNNGTRRSDELVQTFNLLLCEFALQGQVSQPVTDTDLQSAKLIGRHIAVAGGPSHAGERTFGPYRLVACRFRNMGEGYGQENWYWPPFAMWMPRDHDILARLDGLRSASALKRISTTLPTLLVAAAYHTSRHNLAETILTAWIVCEQILSHLWDQYLVSHSNKHRRDRLADFRTYTASVQAEVLLTAGTLGESAYEILQSARKVRNDIAHQKKMGQREAEICTVAMRAMLERIGVSTQRLPGYVQMSGGIGPPQTNLEPEFPFR